MVKLTASIVDTYSGMVQQISSEYAKRYRMVNREDISQELWMWFMKHPNKLREWLEIEDKKESDKLIARSLRNCSEDFCQHEKAAIVGYEVDDVFYYTKEFVKTLLPAVLSEDVVRVQKALENNNGSKSQKNMAESGDWIAYAADIRKAYNSLDDKEKSLVYLFYAQDVDGATLHESAPERPTARAAMMAANRALNKIVRKLGGWKPFKDTDPKEKEEE